MAGSILFPIDGPKDHSNGPINMHEMPDFLTVKQLGDALGLSRSTAYLICRSPGFPAIRVGRQIRIPRSAFERWVREAAAGVSSLPGAEEEPDE